MQRRIGSVVEYEYRVVECDREESREGIRQLLVAHAEYGQWELHRTRIYLGGKKRMWLRRKIIRVPGYARAS